MNAADTLGVVQSFPIGNRAFVDDCLRDLDALGIRRLRTQLSWARYHDDGGAAWYAWLFSTLARRVEVLPFLCDVPPPLSLSGTSAGPVRDPADCTAFVESLIDAVGNCFDAIELWHHPTTLACWDWRLDRDWQVFGSMVTIAADRARRR